MVCKYFIDDNMGACGATGFSHIPLISEMEQLCFKDFHACRIYNEYEDSHVPVNKTVDLATAIGNDKFVKGRWHVHSAGKHG
jgi:hypothetical protein